MKNKRIQGLIQSSELTSILVDNFGENINLARIKLMTLSILAPCKVQTVCFERPACSFDHSAKKASSLRYIQRFMADYMPDTNMIAKLVFALLPNEPPYTLTMDRPNRKFGSTDINALVLAVCYHGVAFSRLKT